jgi:hypothetical protein
LISFFTVFIVVWIRDLDINSLLFLQSCHIFCLNK